MNNPAISPPDIMQFPIHLLSPQNLVDSCVGDHDYDIVVGLMTRFRPHVIVRQLVHHHLKDFEAAAAQLDRVAFQVLRVAGSLSVFSLTDPLFDPRDELCSHLESDDSVERIQSDLIADAINLQETIATITATLQALTADQAKAVWGSIVFGQSAPLSDYEVLTAPWWSAEFITRWAWSIDSTEGRHDLVVHHS